jgi:hypothetical protein
MLLKFMGYLHARKVRFIKKRRRLSLKVSLYDAGLLIAFLSLLTVAYTGELGAAAHSVMAISGIPLIIALCIEINGWIGAVDRWAKRSLYGKALMAGLLTMSASVSAGYASTLINEFSKTASNPFPYTTAFIAVPATVVVAVAFLTLLYISVAIRAFGYGVWSALVNNLLFVVFSERASFKRSRERLGRRVQLEFARLVAMAMLFLVITFALPWFDRALLGVAEIFAYRLETYAQDACAKPHERIVRVDDDVVLVATADKWDVKYEPRLCSRASGLNGSK